MSTNAPSTKAVKWLSDVDKLIESFVIKFKRREIRGSSKVSKETAIVLRQIISTGRFQTVQEILKIIREVGKRLTSAHPIELAVGNVVRRVLMIIRSAEREAGKNEGDAKTADENMGEKLEFSRQLSTLLDAEDEIDSSPELQSISRTIMLIVEEINELIDEIKNSSDTISETASDHIHSREVILTHGFSTTVTNFFQAAKQFREFSVIVAESSPSFEGHRQAFALSRLGIECTVITDSAVFAMMPHVHKVIIGVHAIMPNGGILAHTGALNIAVAANHYQKPLVVLSGIHKLCPLYAYDQDTFNEHNPPSQVLHFEDELVEEVDVQNPALDYVVPEHVELFITNVGSHAPSYLYRRLAEYYTEQDYDL